MTYGNVDRAFMAALVAFAVSCGLSPFVLGFLRRIKSRQRVSEYVPEHSGKQGTPTMGGLIVIVGVLVAMMVCDAGRNVAALSLLVGFALIGFLDDYIVPKGDSKVRGLGWKQKFIAQVVVVVAAFYLDGVRQPWVLAYLAFTVLFFANAFNFADGMDSLAGGIAVMLAIGIAVVARFAVMEAATELSVLVVMAAMAAAFVPFLYLNAPPAKVFMGDVGALPVGALLGWGFLVAGKPSAATPEMSNLIALFAMSLLLVAELVPVPLQVASVKLRKGKRLFPRTPIHHAFQHAGWPETRVVWMFHLVQAVLVAAGIGWLWRVAG